MIRAWIARWRARRAEAAALNRYGWDGGCVGCGQWLHANGGKCIATEPHDAADPLGPEWWIYRCALCGADSEFIVGPYPLPIRADECGIHRKAA